MALLPLHYTLVIAAPGCQSPAPFGSTDVGGAVSFVLHFKSLLGVLEKMIQPHLEQKMQDSQMLWMVITGLGGFLFRALILNF